MGLDIEGRLAQIEVKLDRILKLIDPEIPRWQISDKPITRIELEYWSNNRPDGTFDTPGFRMKLQESGTKKADTYKQLYGKDVNEYDIKHFKELAINTNQDFTWLSKQVAEYKCKYKNHHIAFFHQYYANTPDMEEVFNNFVLVVERGSLSGVAIFRCINDKPIIFNVQFEAKSVNGAERYFCILAANQLKPIRMKIK